MLTLAHRLPLGDAWKNYKYFLLCSASKICEIMCSFGVRCTKRKQCRFLQGEKKNWSGKKKREQFFFLLLLLLLAAHLCYLQRIGAGFDKKKHPLTISATQSVSPERALAQSYYLWHKARLVAVRLSAQGFLFSFSELTSLSAVSSSKQSQFFGGGDCLLYTLSKLKTFFFFFLFFSLSRSILIFSTTLKICTQICY